MADNDQSKTAQLYRMVMSEHLCPFGLKSKFLLKRKGYRVEDHHLTTREETDAFQKKYNVSTTPQAFIDGQRIGGYEELREYFELDDPDTETSYQPVIAIFGTALLMAVATMWFFNSAVFSLITIEKFVAIA
nr:glutaredoxin [Marinobacter sp. DS40M8]